MAMRWRWAAAIAALVAPGAMGDAEIILRATARVPEGAALTLGDVALLRGPEAQALADAVILASARDGTIAVRDVRAALDADPRVDWGRVLLNGSTCAVAVERAEPEPAPAPREDAPAPAPAPGTIGALVGARVAQFLGVEPADLRLRFDDRDREFLAQAVAPGRAAEARPTAISERMPVAVTLYEADRIVASRSVRVGVAVRRSVAVAAVEKRRGEAIGADEVRAEERWLPPGDRPVTAEEVVGSLARSRIDAGDAIEPADVQPPLVVRKGEPVSVHCLSGTVIVRTTARALEDAPDGRLLRLESIDGQRRFWARTSGPGRAVAVAPVRQEDQP